ncbi:MAG: hypothetical protein WDW38_002129 [Sanguina aurantia]
MAGARKRCCLPLQGHRLWEQPRGATLTAMPLEWQACSSIAFIAPFWFCSTSTLDSSVSSCSCSTSFSDTSWEASSCSLAACEGGMGSGSGADTGGVFGYRNGIRL